MDYWLIMFFACFIRRLWCALLVAVSLSALAEPLPVKEAFHPSLSQTANNTYALHIAFAEGYYIYVDRTSLSANDAPLNFGATPSTIKNDPYFGDTAVWDHPPTLTVTSEKPLTSVDLLMQGCEDGVICYPPTRWTLTTEASTSDIDTLLHPNAHFNAQQNIAAIAVSDEPLPDQQAFAASLSSDNGRIRLSIDMPPHYYLYRDSLSVHANNQEITNAIAFPPSAAHDDPFRGAQAIYRNQVAFSLPYIDAEHVNLQLAMQGCLEDVICYPPQQRSWQLSTGELGELQAQSSRAATTSSTIPDIANSDPLSNTLHTHFWRTLPLLLSLGIALSFTACVYPLIPIVTSLVVGKNSSNARSYALISVYVLAMGLAMGALGAVFALFNLNLQVVLQTPWITALVALLFAALALSLFDVYSLHAPRWLQGPIDRLNRRQQSGSFIGAAVMGALSVLVVSPCATPVLTALLLFTTQTTPLKGATALFVFGIGTGLPLLLFAGVLRRFMPKAGAWMDTIKKGFAFALLAIAVWLVARITPAPWALLIWAAYALLFASIVLPSDGLRGFGGKARLFLAAGAFMVALSLTISASQRLFLPANNASAGSAAQAPFQIIDNENALSNAIARSAKPVIVDFYADWCASCRQWERNIWQNPRFASAWDNYTLLKIDVTSFTDAHQAIFRRLNLVGPPAVLFYPAGGNIDQPQTRIIGERSADEFAQMLGMR